MTLDEQPYYNPAATTFCLEQPFAIPGETTFKEQKQAETNPLLRMQPGYSSSDTFSMLFEAALNRSFDGLTNWKRGDDLRPLLTRLAEHCYKAGIPEEEGRHQYVQYLFHCFRYFFD